MTILNLLYVNLIHIWSTEEMSVWHAFVRHRQLSMAVMLSTRDTRNKNVIPAQQQAAIAYHCNALRKKGLVPQPSVG